MRTLILALTLALVTPVQPDVSPFLGKWNMTGTGDNTAVVYWLEVTQEGGALKGRFLNRASSPYDLPSIKVENGELIFANAPREGQPPPPVWRARVVDGRLVGTTTIARRDPAQPPQVINWVGVRPPAWPAAKANGTHTYGDPVSLFDGTTMDAWGVQHKQRPINWSVADGVMSSADKAGNNLVSTQTFDDFRIEAEYAIAAGSNGGIYVRGRYELQLLDDAGQPVTPQSHMAIYGRTPPAVNASRPAGEWQRMEAVVVGNRVTVTLNGQKVHDNAVIEGITGGALDANEAAPGPIMLQGDHGKVMFRKVVVTPITSGGESVQYRSPAGVEYRAHPDTNAIKTARAALAADPRNVAKLIELGVAESGARQFREAIATFTRGLEIEPNSALLLRWRGHRYLSVRDFDRAYADLTRGTKIDPSIYGLWYHLGVVQFVRGEFAAAAESFARAQPIAPDAGELAGSTDWLWMSLSRAGRTADAKAMLDRRPDNKPVTNAYTRRLQLYRGEIGPEAVIAAADTEDVQLATLAYGLGNWHLVRGDTAQARAAFERAVQSGGWPAFGFIAAEAELRRRAPAR